MLLPQFEYHEPRTLAEACEIMVQFAGKAKALAGGTDLLVNMKKKILSPEHVVCIDRLEELKGISASGGTVSIGACEKVADIASSEQISSQIGALATGASNLGSPLIRNLATIAGNLGSARPAADLPPSLMAYGAEVVLKKRDGERVVKVEELFQGPGETVIASDELIEQIRVPVPASNYGAHYIKLGVRRALEISIVNVAAFVQLDSDGKHIEQARIVLGSVAPTPIRAPSAESLLKGEEGSDSLFEKAGEAAASEAKPIDDFRASAEYRRDMVAVLTKRTLKRAFEEALRS